MRTEQELEAALAMFPFDPENPFTSCEDVRSFFTPESVADKLGGTSYTAEELAALADHVIAHSGSLPYCRFSS